MLLKRPVGMQKHSSRNRLFRKGDHMPSSVVEKLRAQIQMIADERQGHVDAIAEIDEFYSQFGIMTQAVGKPRKKPGRKPGRKARPDGDVIAPKRKPGRPKGSKNKVKKAAASDIHSGPPVAETQTQTQVAQVVPQPSEAQQKNDSQDPLPSKRGRPKGRKPKAKIGRPKGSKNKI
jgi:hypothetical protein